PLLASLALAGVITAGVLVLSCLLFILGYVYRDAKRRGMNPALWTLLVLLLSGPYVFIGLIVYLLIRDPLPYACPQCSASVSARFNFCPNCKCNLRPPARTASTKLPTRTSSAPTVPRSSRHQNRRSHPQRLIPPRMGRNAKANRRAMRQSHGQTKRWGRRELCPS